jgi:hypothetical protein
MRPESYISLLVKGLRKLAFIVVVLGLVSVFDRTYFSKLFQTHLAPIKKESELTRIPITD